MQNNEINSKIVILTNEQYNQICKFINDYIGLPIDCELELKKRFNYIEACTLGSIINKKWQSIAKKLHPKMIANCKRLLAEYEELTSKSNNVNIILNIAIREHFPPMGICRILLTEKFKKYPKADIIEMLKNPDLIPNPLMAANVYTCFYNDSREGILPDISRRCVGEEYECKLKEMAKSVGMIFYDENDLRHKGFDKTPDLILAVPCMYKGKIIHWIESKALFGDVDSHQKYIRDQLASYGNRFGAGLVIYWFGYVDMVTNWTENGDLINVTESFPIKSDLEFLTFSE